MLILQQGDYIPAASMDISNDVSILHANAFDLVKYRASSLYYVPVDPGGFSGYRGFWCSSPVEDNFCVFTSHNDRSYPTIY